MEAACFVSYICWFLQEYGTLRLRCFNLLRQMFQVGSFLVSVGGVRLRREAGCTVVGKFQWTVQHWSHPS